MATVAPTRAELDSFLRDHTQIEAARHYGVSDRTIRNWRNSLPDQAEPAPATATADQAEPNRLRRCTPNASRYHRPDPPTQAMRRYIPRPANMVATGREDWIDYRGEYVRPPAGMTGARWNGLQYAALRALETGLPEPPPQAPEPEPEPEMSAEAAEIVNKLETPAVDFPPPPQAPEPARLLPQTTTLVKRFVVVETRPGLLWQLWASLPPNIWAGIFIVIAVVIICEVGQ